MMKGLCKLGYKMPEVPRNDWPRVVSPCPASKQPLSPRLIFPCCQTKIFKLQKAEARISKPQSVLPSWGRILKKGEVPREHLP